MTVIRSLVLSILSRGNGEMTRHFNSLKTRRLVHGHRGRCDRSISCLAETHVFVVGTIFWHLLEIVRKVPDRAFCYM